MKPSCLIFHTIVALAFSASSLSAKTLHVSGQGSDDNDGTASTKAFRSLQKPPTAPNRATPC